MMCYKYRYESFMFTWSAVLHGLGSANVCGCMGHITAWTYVNSDGLQ